MKVAFYYNRRELRIDDLENGVIGGSEAALLSLVQAWVKQYPDDEVILYNGNHSPMFMNGLGWGSINNFLGEVRNMNADAFITFRDTEPLWLPYIDAKLICFWSQDLSNEPKLQTLQSPDAIYQRDRIDLLFTVSEFAFRDLVATFPNMSVSMIRNGYNKEFVVNTAKKPIAIYTSNPGRGLQLLVRMWPKIRKRVQKLNVDPELHIYGSPAQYSEHTPSSTQHLYAVLDSMEGVTVVGGVSRKKMYRKLSEATVLLYPNTFPESSCMAVIDAIACGCTVVTSKQGALPEVGRSFAYFASGDPESESYQEYFMRAAVEAFTTRLSKANHGLQTWKESAVWMRDIIERAL